MVFSIGNIQNAAGAQGQAFRLVQARLDSQTIVAGMARLSVACNRRNRTGLDLCGYHLFSGFPGLSGFSGLFGSFC
jgi:hypothetical protein